MIDHDLWLESRVHGASGLHLKKRRVSEGGLKQFVPPQPSVPIRALASLVPSRFHMKSAYELLIFSVRSHYCGRRLFDEMNCLFIMISVSNLPH